MDSYSVLLERIRLPQPSMQRFAVISIFEKLRSAPYNLDANSDSGRDAISECLRSTSAAVVDQSVRELCRFVKEGHLEVPQALLELQSALDGCDSRFVNIFVKGIGFLVRFAFQKNDMSWRLDSPENHPFVKVVSCRTEVHGELVQQVLLLIAENKRTGLVEVSKFLRLFLNFSTLRVYSSASSFSFTRLLVSSVASLSCSFPSEAMPILKLLMECFKYFPRKNAQDMKNLIEVAEYLVDAFTVILRNLFETGLSIKEAQLCSLQLLEFLLSLQTDFYKLSGGSELILKQSKSLLLIQKELGLPYIPELLSVKMSLFLILTRAEFEHEQLSALKLAVILLEWKNEYEYGSGEAAFGPSEELLFLLPVISLLSSPSNSIKTAASGFLTVLEDLLGHLSVASKKVPRINEEFPFISKPESIICRLLWDLWQQDASSFSTSYFLSLASIGKTNIKVMNSDRKPWMSQLKEYALWTAERKKSPLLNQPEGNISSEMHFLLGSINAVLVMHHSLGSCAIDSLAAIGLLDPRLGIPLLLAILFYNKVLCNNKSSSREILIHLLQVLPPLASHSAMIPLIIQTILPMLHKEAKPVLYATAVRLLCKTWEVTDRVFGNLQVLLHPKRFSEFMSESNICISMSASVRDVCRKNPDRGVDLILSVSACIESQDPVIQTLGFQSLSHLCEADVVDFYTAWDVIAKHVLDYAADPVLAHGLCLLLRWGAMDAEAYPESSKSVLQILWEIGCRQTGLGPMWTKARVCAFQALTHYEVAHIQKGIADFKKRNVDLLISEDNVDVLRAMAEFEVKIITFEHINRRRLLKEKRTAESKVDKLLDVFPQVIFHSGKGNCYTRDFPGAALLLLSVTSKDVHNQQTPKELANLHTAYENALVEVADSLQLSRNFLVALLSLESWKAFMQRWMKSAYVFVDAKFLSTALDKTSKIANDVLKRMCRIAEGSIPRCAENIALAIGAFCMVLPSSAHAVTATASKFLLKWLFQYEHEYRQWTAAIAVGLVSRCLHGTDHKTKFQIITGLLEVAIRSKSTLVKGACGVGLGFTCEDLSGAVAPDDSVMEEETNGLNEAKLLGKIVRTLSLIICQLIPSSSDSLQSLWEYFPLADDMDAYIDPDLSADNHENLEEDLWGVAGLVLGLGNSVNAMYRYGTHDAVLKIKSLFISWIPCLSTDFQTHFGCWEEPEIPLSVGSCLALPIVVAFCQRVELIDESEVGHLVAGYKELVCELLSLKKSGASHQSLLMSSCVGAGTLVSCILSEGVLPMKIEDVTSLLEILRKCYASPYPPIVNFSGMLGVVNALGANAGSLTLMYPHPSLRTGYGQKESSYIREPILSSSVCESLSSSLVQEMFLVSQDSKDQQLQRYAAWALAFLRHRWWSKELQIVKHSSQRDQIDSGHVSRSFPEDSVVWRLCTWLMDLNSMEVCTTAHVNTVTTILRCLSRAPRLPSLDWGVIIRRCMKFKDQVSGNQCPDPAAQKVTLREDCVQFSLAHANQVNPLLLFLDEISDLSRFRTLELSLQSSVLCHLADLTKIFSVSRLEKLFDDMADFLGSPVSSYHAYNSNQKNLFRISFWKGLNQCLDEAFVESQEYVTNMEKCMEFLFASLPVLPFDVLTKPEEADCIDEWSEAVICLGKAPKRWLMDLLEVPEGCLVQGSQFTELVKRIQARAKLVMIGSIPLTELGKLKASILNTESDGIWYVLVEVAAALQFADGGIKRQWLIDVIEICCITKYPFTALLFLGLLTGSWSKYMPLLILDPMPVLSDLPVTLPALLSESSWNFIAESVVLNLWELMERIYDWFRSLGSDSDVLRQQVIDESEDWKAIVLVRVMHHTCVSLLEYLPFEKQLKLANMMIPEA